MSPKNVPRLSGGVEEKLVGTRKARYLFLGVTQTHGFEPQFPHWGVKNVE